MQCKVFAGLIPDAVEQYNEWAEGKWLAKDVIVHTHAAPASPDGKVRPALMIAVFFDEKVHPEWVDKK